MSRSLTIIFWLLIAMALLVVCEMFISPVNEFLQGPVFLLPMVLFSLTGGILLFMIFRQNVEKPLKTWLVITGVFSTGFFVSVFLHNMIYALVILLFGPDIWENIGMSDEPVFFIIGVVICPVGFLIGAVGSIVMLIKRRYARELQ